MTQQDDLPPFESLIKGRDNNFNLIRMIAATLVLVSHAYPITRGKGAAEPLEALTGFALGDLSVIVFFVISGFLIAASFERTPTRKAFVAARILRLYPALIVSLIFTLALGVIATNLPLVKFLTSSETLTFIPRNIALLFPQYDLPGVFTTQPYPDIVGSIWTLIYEIFCYIGVFIVGICGLLHRRLAMAILIGGAVAAFASLYWFEPSLHPKIRWMIYFTYPFAIGMAFYLARDRLPMSAFGLTVLALVSWLVRDMALFPVVFFATLAYATFWLAYVPGGFMRRYNDLGDYSYGIYIYAFPIQTFVVFLLGDQTPWMNIAVAFPITLALSVASWHMIEAPSLRLRHRIAPVS